MGEEGFEGGIEGDRLVDLGRGARTVGAEADQLLHVGERGEDLPRLLERAGPGMGEGTITGLFTVLVEGDDHNEPVADAVRGILDGHIVMERGIAERGRYPAINVLKSVSRTMPRSCHPAYLPVVMKARQVLATYTDMEELIRLGAYRAGSSAEVDEAIALFPSLDAFLNQSKEEATSIGDGYARLADILNGA